MSRQVKSILLCPQHITWRGSPVLHFNFQLFFRRVGWNKCFKYPPFTWVSICVPQKISNTGKAQLSSHSIPTPTFVQPCWEAHKSGLITPKHIQMLLWASQAKTEAAVYTKSPCKFHFDVQYGLRCGVCIFSMIIINIQLI